MLVGTPFPVNLSVYDALGPALTGQESPDRRHQPNLRRGRMFGPTAPGAAKAGRSVRDVLPATVLVTILNGAPEFNMINGFSRMSHFVAMEPMIIPRCRTS